MRKPTTRENEIKLDRNKLIGFRNLLPVTSSEKDAREKAELAFNKVGGTETTA